MHLATLARSPMRERTDPIGPLRLSLQARLPSIIAADPPAQD